MKKNKIEQFMKERITLLTAISEVKKDDVYIREWGDTVGNMYIRIRTKNYKIIIGVNDAGTWLHKFNKIKRQRILK